MVCPKFRHLPDHSWLPFAVTKAYGLLSAGIVAQSVEQR